VRGSPHIETHFVELQKTFEYLGFAVSTDMNSVLRALHKTPDGTKIGSREDYFDPRYPADEMVAEPVSTHVNNVRNIAPECGIATALQERGGLIRLSPMRTRIARTIPSTRSTPISFRT
jgi:hypothetical protein